MGTSSSKQQNTTSLAGAKATAKARRSTARKKSTKKGGKDVVNNTHEKPPRKPSKVVEKVLEPGHRILQLVGDDLTKDYELLRTVGQGHYGKVRSARRLAGSSKNVNKDCKEIVAVKSILKTKIRRFEILRREISIMRGLDHPNVVKFLDVYEDDTHVHIVMEFCRGGELFDRILEKGRFTERDAAKILQQQLLALEYLHSKKVVHRDLKPENFLFKSYESDEELKLIDFGLSRVFEDTSGGGEFLRTRVGTPYYIAPEVLRKEYSNSCDIWSIGVILYIMLCGYPPFYGDSDREIFEAVARAKFTFPKEEWDCISPAAKHLISQMLAVDPAERPSASEALSHRWVVRSCGPPSNKDNINDGKQHTGLEPESLGTVRPGIDAKAPATTDGSELDLIGLKSERSLGEHVLSNIRKFSAHNKFKRRAFQVIARTLQEHEIKALLPQFHTLDHDHDGVVTAQELAKGMRNLGMDPSAEEVEKLLGDIDADGDGRIDYKEFVAASMERHQYLRDEVVREAFKHFDSSGKGTITVEDLKKELDLEQYPALVDEIVSQVDQNNDGVIDFAEFKEMLQSVP